MSKFTIGDRITVKSGKYRGLNGIVKGFNCKQQIYHVLLDNNTMVSFMEPILQFENIPNEQICERKTLNN